MLLDPQIQTGWEALRRLRQQTLCVGQVIVVPALVSRIQIPCQLVHGSFCAKQLFS